jgi:hypothetical protein
MLTWNDIIDIELRNKDNPDVALLVAALRGRVSITALTEGIEQICADQYRHGGHGDYLENDRVWKYLVSLCDQ